MDGMPLGEVSGIWVLDDGVGAHVVRTGRVGISKGADLPLRFLAADSGFVT
jgi:3-methyladenine DNA glycosylase Mpg